MYESFCKLRRLPFALTMLTRESGRLLQWVNLAFGLAHENRDDATLYQLCIGFLLREYTAGLVHEVIAGRRAGGVFAMREPGSMPAFGTA